MRSHLATQNHHGMNSHPGVALADAVHAIMATATSAVLTAKDPMMVLSWFEADQSRSSSLSTSPDNRSKCVPAQ